MAAPLGPDDPWDQFDPITGQGALPLFNELPAPPAPDTSAPKPSFEAISIFDEPEAARDNRVPAELTENPTSTTDPDRPRTAAAGYNSRSRTLTVVFRDGTWWNYYDVSPLIWKNFKSAYSKGWYLYTSGLDNWPNMGPANEGWVPASDRRTLLAAARVIQRRTGGITAGQSSAYAARLLKQNAGIKEKGTLTPRGDRISNPYVERQRNRRRRGT